MTTRDSGSEVKRAEPMLRAASSSVLRWNLQGVANEEACMSGLQLFSQRVWPSRCATHRPLCPPVQRGWNNRRTDRCDTQRRMAWRAISRNQAKRKYMKQNIAVEQFLAGR